MGPVGDFLEYVYFLNPITTCSNFPRVGPVVETNTNFSKTSAQVFPSTSSTKTIHWIYIYGRYIEISLLCFGGICNLQDFKTHLSCNDGGYMDNGRLPE